MVGCVKDMAMVTEFLLVIYISLGFDKDFREEWLHVHVDVPVNEIY